MNTRNLTAALACTALLAACGGGGDGGSGTPPVDNGDHNTGNQKGALSIVPDSLLLLQGEVVDVKVMQGDTDVTDKAKLTVEGTAFDLTGHTIGAAEPGRVKLIASLDGQTVSAAGRVDVPTSVEIRAPAKADWSIGKTIQLETWGERSGNSRKLTYNVQYKSSDEDVATVDANGLVTVVGAGPVSLTAQVGAVLSHAVDATVDCGGSYPAGTQGIGYGKTMPNATWPAYWPDGRKFELSLAKLRCQPEWKNTKTITFIASAGWCGPCTAYAQELTSQYQDLEARGMKIAIIEMEDYNGVPATADFAFEHLGSITSNNRPAIALGDADTTPAHVVRDSNWLTFFPTAFVVRLSDMKIIADQKKIADDRGANVHLPLADIADHPEADWSALAPFINNCKPGEEEAGEPNNSASEASGPVGAGVFHGGICDQSTVDIYEVDPGGTWTATLTYDPGVANLSLYVWDRTRDQIALIGGKLYGSQTGSGRETFDFTGKALVAVMGVDSSSAPYTLTIAKK